MKGPGDLDYTTWKVYSDYSVDIKTAYILEDIKESTNKLTKENYESLLNNIESAKVKDMDIDAVDGDAWEFTEYQNGKIIWQREIGYIYGFKELEDATSIINNIK